MKLYDLVNNDNGMIISVKKMREFIAIEKNNVYAAYGINCIWLERID